MSLKNALFPPLSVVVVFDVYRDSQVGSPFASMEAKGGTGWSGSLGSGKGVAHRPEPLRRGDRRAAVQLGGAHVRRPHPAAGQPGAWAARCLNLQPTSGSSCHVAFPCRKAQRFATLPARWRSSPAPAWATESLGTLWTSPREKTPTNSLTSSNWWFPFPELATVANLRSCFTIQTS